MVFPSTFSHLNFGSVDNMNTISNIVGDWKDVSIAHVIFIIKSDVSTFPIVIIFFRGCVSEMFATLYSVTYCIYIPGKREIFFHYYCAAYDECKWSDTFWLEDRIRLFVHYTISLSSLCKLIWRHWTYKMPVRYSFSSVWVRSGNSLSYPLQNTWGCVFSVDQFPLWWLREYIYFVLLS